MIWPWIAASVQPLVAFHEMNQGNVPMAVACFLMWTAALWVAAGQIIAWRR